MSAFGSIYVLLSGDQENSLGDASVRGAAGLGCAFLKQLGWSARKVRLDAPEGDGALD
jgi:hypothetical protein